MRNLFSKLRTSVRKRFFAGIRHVANIDDTREIASQALHLQPAVSGMAELAACQDLETPYFEARRSPAAPRQRRPLFITGRFRSGSTLLWQLFRAIPGCTSYYEPFNQRRWFDPATRGTHVDPTHVNVTNYWAEFDGLAQLGALYDESWTRRQLYMDASAWNSPMQRYIQALVDHAPGRAVLQFNDVDLRLQWLRARFPEAEILHIVRNPRDQFCSTLPRRELDVTSLRMRDFQPLDGFYLLPWGRDLRYFFPFLTMDDDAHPYELYYQVWKLSYLFGKVHSDLSIPFETLVRDPAREVARVMACFGLTGYDLDKLVGLVAPVQEGKWRQRASADFFGAIEARVERQLANYLGALAPRRELPRAALMAG